MKKINWNFKKLSRYQVMFLVGSFLVVSLSLLAYMKTYSEFVSNVPNSGVVGNVVYVNDYEKDYNYYQSLNYTELTSRTALPSYHNKYNDDTLALVNITYDGHDVNDNSLVGYVSSTEKQDTFIYSKLYYVQNGYVDVELIDNPYSQRPDGKGFNGWVCNASESDDDICKTSTMSLDMDYYVRHIKIPVSGGETVNIQLNASWINADIKTGTGSTFNDVSMQRIYPDQGHAFDPARDYAENTSYHVNNGQHMTGMLASNNTFVDENCNNWNGCDYYPVVYSARYGSTNATINDWWEYRTLDDNGQLVIVQLASSRNLNYLLILGPNPNVDDNLSGLFYRSSGSKNGNNLYYDNKGVNCANGGNCGSEGYKLIQTDDTLNKSDGTSISVATRTLSSITDRSNYYYLVTRDTNIMDLNGNINITDIGGKNFPFTVTSNPQATGTKNTITVNNNVSFNRDVNIEYVNMTTNGTNTTQGSTQSIFANYQNIKIGRTVSYSGNNNSANNVFGGANDNQAHSNQNMRVIVEGGRYNTLTSASATTPAGTNMQNIHGQFIYGSDYDRVSNDDSKLLIRVRAVSNSDSNGQGAGGNFTSSNSDDVVPCSQIIIKSGIFGYGSPEGPYGLYVGGQYGNGRSTMLKTAIVEGGQIFNISGGSDAQAGQNVVGIYITGGLVINGYGGATSSSTRGNRILSVSGGQIVESIAGGSNANSGGDNNAGDVNGNTLVYVGGNALIGGRETAVSKLYNNINTSWLSNNAHHFGLTEDGLVLGAGLGKNGGGSQGSVVNSTVIINGGTIEGAVYGGGNYGAVGVSNSATSSTTNIYIYDGEILGSVYGGGNNNGSGTTSKPSTVNINMTGGTIEGSLYGGSNVLGTIYGSVNVNVTGGEIDGGVYGGGKGGYTSNNAIGTYVRDAVNVVIGDSSLEEGPTIGKVYGGSAFGTVNGTTRDNTVSSSGTNVTINNGEIGSVFGGGEGNDTYTPYVKGNVLVTVNGGTIDNVFGGNDEKGTPNGKIDVYIKGGEVTNTFGGGNYASVKTSNVYLDGGTSTNIFGGGNEASITTSNVKLNSGTATNVYGGCNKSDATTANVELKGASVVNIFGGSNESGVVTTSNVTTTSGEVTNVYGGNNAGGSTTTTNVNINNGTINGAVYGGGNQATSGTTHVNLNGTSVDTVYGGGNKAGVTESTNVVLKGSNVEDIFGGSNESGVVTTSNVTTTSGEVTNVYGGNNAGGSTTTTNVNINNGTINGAVYGGGNQATSGTTNVNLNGTSVNTVYGGGNEAGITESTNVILKGSDVNTLYGGSNKSGTVPESHVHALKGSCDELLGGNNAGGTTTTTNIVIDGGDIGNVYGGGNRAVSTTSNIDINIASDKIANVYGGGNQAVVTTANIDVNGGAEIGNVYGGSNEAGDVTDSYININTPTVCVVPSVDPGEDPGEDPGTGGEDPGTGGEDPGTGGEDPGTGGEDPGEEPEYIPDSLRVSLSFSDVSATQAWMGTSYKTYARVKVTLENISDTAVINDWSGTLTIPQSSVAHNYSGTALTQNGNDFTFTARSVYFNGNNTINPGSSYSFEVEMYSNQNVNSFTGEYLINYTDSRGFNGTLPRPPEPEPEDPEPVDPTPVDPEPVDPTPVDPTPVDPEPVDPTPVDPGNCDVKIDTIYGGNNHGGVTSHSNVNVESGIIGNIYGGGNLAVTGNTLVNVKNASVTGSVYGGGNQAGIDTTTYVNIIDAEVSGNVFGGGNLGIVGTNTDVYISSATVGGSVYAGGNGSTAVVNGNTLLNIDGETEITKHVFGGGNAAATGTEANNNSTGVVNIVGGTIGGNVYGGANTSVLYGETTVNIGKNVVSDDTLTPSDIQIGGTVFGGGEANASGDDNYDYSFISVTKGITINIDGLDHEEFNIDGSIFGSGNASSTTGYSNIYISNYGTKDEPKTNISIQRADLVNISNSYIILEGATDRTNEYSTTLFTLSRIGNLTVKNGTNLYLLTGANLLEYFKSAVDVDGEEVKAQVVIDDDGNIVSRNVDNRIYVKENKVLNIAKNQSVTSYGEVDGMAFFGMFRLERDAITTGLYDSSYENGDTLTREAARAFSTGSAYVLGLHETNHNIKVDGFYTNYSDIDSDNPEAIQPIRTAYIEPEPAVGQFYMWTIGVPSENIEIDLTASKYSTLGAQEVLLNNFASGNTYFNVVSFSYDEIDDDVSLVNPNSIPRIADSEDDADNVMGLAMKTGTNGWITLGSTNFLTDSDVGFSGTTIYQAENSTVSPSLLFYLYHSKNLGTAASMGSVVVSLLAITPISPIENEVKGINITINLSRALYNTDDYEGSMTPGREYNMFSSSATNITSSSSLSAYYSLYIKKDKTIYQDGFHHVLSSTLLFPENTKITMIDFANSGNPEYYYYVVNSADNQALLAEYNRYGTAAYPLSKFIRMGSSSSGNHYDDEVANANYYDENRDIAVEEFIFIVDFKDSNITENQLEKSLMLEIRNDENAVVYTVLGIQHENMIYNLYADNDGVIELEADLNPNTIYLGEDVELNVTTNFVQSIDGSGNKVIDTNFYGQKLGIKISIEDNNGNQVNGVDLMGINFEYGGEDHYPRSDGSVRINLAERVANVATPIIIHTANSNLTTGEYKLHIESFCSPDGIYYGLNSSDSIDITMNVYEKLYGLKVSLEPNMVIVSKDTGLTLNDTNLLNFTVNYSSGLSNPNIRLALYRRKYDEVYDTEYTVVNVNDYITDELVESNVENVFKAIPTPLSTQSFKVHLKNKLTSGTYKFQFRLYDGNAYIGEVSQYVIIK